MSKTLSKKTSKVVSKKLKPIKNNKFFTYI